MQFSSQLEAKHLSMFQDINYNNFKSSACGVEDIYSFFTGTCVEQKRCQTLKRSLQLVRVCDDDQEKSTTQQRDLHEVNIPYKATGDIIRPLLGPF